MTNSQKTVLILVNKQTTIVNFRLEVVSALVKAGYRVVVSVPEGDRLNEIAATGAEIIITPMEKDGTDPIKDVVLTMKYIRMIKKTRANVVLTYTIKPNVYGGMAAAAAAV
jgi:galacturonosyltransferase